jgi:hypothetical protein
MNRTTTADHLPLAKPIPDGEAPDNVWSLDVVDWYHVAGVADWLFVPRAEAPPGRQIELAFVRRCAEELTERRVLIGDEQTAAYSWHDMTLMIMSYARLHRDGQLDPINALFGVVANAVRAIDSAAADMELAATP